MNLDKTIKELTNRLDVVYPYSSSSSNDESNMMELIIGKVKR